MILNQTQFQSTKSNNVFVKLETFRYRNGWYQFFFLKKNESTEYKNQNALIGTDSVTKYGTKPITKFNQY